MKQLRNILLMIGVFLAPAAMATSITDQLSLLAPIADFEPKRAAFRARELMYLVSLSREFDPQLSVDFTPIRRAHSRFRREENTCIIDRQRAPGPGEIASRVLYTHAFYLYASAIDGIRTLNDVKRAGTIVGAELYLSETVRSPYSWSYAVNFENLIAMLKSGRVDAITLNTSYFVDAGNLTFPIRPLGDGPIAEIDIGLRCKATEHTKDYVRFVEESWDEWASRQRQRTGDR